MRKRSVNSYKRALIRGIDKFMQGHPTAKYEDYAAVRTMPFFAEGNRNVDFAVDMLAEEGVVQIHYFRTAEIPDIDQSAIRIINQEKADKYRKPAPIWEDIRFIIPTISAIIFGILGAYDTIRDNINEKIATSTSSCI